MHLHNHTWSWKYELLLNPWTRNAVGSILSLGANKTDH